MSTLLQDSGAPPEAHTLQDLQYRPFTSCEELRIFVRGAAKRMGSADEVARDEVRKVRVWALPHHSFRGSCFFLNSLLHKMCQPLWNRKSAQTFS